MSEINEFWNPDLLNDCNMIVKCKKSCLLKVYSMFRETNNEPVNGDVIVLPEHHYFKFIYGWTHFSHSWEVEPMVRHLFRGIMILMQNQIMLELVKTMSEK